MTNDFIRDKRGGDTHIEERPCEDRDREWSYVATSQGTPGATRSWKRQERFLS